MSWKDSHEQLLLGMWEGFFKNKIFIFFSFVVELRLLKCSDYLSLDYYDWNTHSAGFKQI